MATCHGPGRTAASSQNSRLGTTPAGRQLRKEVLALTAHQCHRDHWHCWGGGKRAGARVVCATELDSERCQPASLPHLTCLGASCSVCQVSLPPTCLPTNTLLTIHTKVNCYLTQHHTPDSLTSTTSHSTTTHPYPHPTSYLLHHTPLTIPNRCTSPLASSSHVLSTPASQESPEISDFPAMMNSEYCECTVSIWETRTINIIISFLDISYDFSDF